MVGDGPDLNSQFSRNASVVLAVRHEPQDLPFPAGQVEPFLFGQPPDLPDDLRGYSTQARPSTTLII